MRSLSRAIRNLNFAACIVDEAFALQLSRRGSDRGAARAEHLREKLLGQLQLV